MGFWALTRYDDVMAAFRDSATYISSEGNFIDGSDKGLGYLIGMDPPEHTSFRKAMTPHFTMREIAKLEHFIRTLTTEKLDQIRGENSFDLVESFALALPLSVISEILGIPVELRSKFNKLAKQLTDRPAGSTDVPAESLAAAMEMHQMATELAIERRQNPKDDYITALTQSEVTDGMETWIMTDQQVAAQIVLLATAGYETTYGLIGAGAVALWQNPDQRRQLVGDPGLIPGAVEEMVRYDNPAPLEGRWSTRDVHIHGTTIPKNSRVMLINGAANRDERRYDDPNRFDIHRKVTRPMGFGFGIHLCLGAHLARLESRIAFEEFLKVFPDYEIDLAGAVRGTSTFRTYTQLPVTVG
jgi:cytochrome P450